MLFFFNKNMYCIIMESGYCYITMDNEKLACIIYNMHCSIVKIYVLYAAYVQSSIKEDKKN
jgi:hypothetical protein